VPSQQEDCRGSVGHGQPQILREKITGTYRAAPPTAQRERENERVRDGGAGKKREMTLQGGPYGGGGPMWLHYMREQRINGAKMKRFRERIGKGSGGVRRKRQSKRGGVGRMFSQGGKRREPKGAGMTNGSMKHNKTTD